MKLYPIGELVGVPELPEELRRGRADVVGLESITSRLEAWTSWTVRAQNYRRKYLGRPVFAWNVGDFVSPRFETAALLWMRGRALFRLGRYFEARESFTGCASEIIVTRDRLGPLTLDGCGKMRLRCLMRSQRERILALGNDPCAVAPRALWLVHAEQVHATIPGPDKEPLEGEGWFFAAEAALAHRSGRREDASHLATRASRFPSKDLDEIEKAPRGVALWERVKTTRGAFDWGHFSGK